MSTAQSRFRKRIYKAVTKIADALQNAKIIYISSQYSGLGCCALVSFDQNLDLLYNVSKDAKTHVIPFDCLECHRPGKWPIE